MKQILNDYKLKWFNANKSLERVLIENCPMSDVIFTEITAAYGVPEDECMDLMSESNKGQFIRVGDGWGFISG